MQYNAGRVYLLFMCSIVLTSNITVVILWLMCAIQVLRSRSISCYFVSIVSIVCYSGSEERDYYPYWYPSPWKDAAIFSGSEEYCEYVLSYVKYM